MLLWLLGPPLFDHGAAGLTAGFAFSTSAEQLFELLLLLLFRHLGELFQFFELGFDVSEKIHRL